MLDVRQTFVDDYKGCLITVLALKEDYGWSIEVSAVGEDVSVEKCRDYSCFTNIEVAHAAGIAWGMSLVDDRVM
jgi:hypothetical protein